MNKYKIISYKFLIYTNIHNESSYALLVLSVFIYLSFINLFEFISGDIKTMCQTNSITCY